MKKALLLSVIFCAFHTTSFFAQFVIRSTYLEPQSVSNQGVVSGYEQQAGPYWLWDADANTNLNIGGLAPGSGIGGAAKFSANGNLLSGTSLGDYQGTDYPMMSQYDIISGVWTPLGHLNYPVDDTLSGGYNISGDGSTVIGNSWYEPEPGTTGLGAHAVAWTQATGMIDLGTLFPNNNRSTRAEAANHDGSIIVGWQDFNGPWKSAVWRKDSNGDFLPNEYLLIDPNGDPTDEFNQLGEARAISADGIWIGGQGDYANNDEPWLWSESTGYMGLGSFGGQGKVMGMTGDGSVVIGYFDSGNPFIWNAADGMQNLETYITDILGYDLGDHILFSANSISPNGKYIAGTGLNTVSSDFIVFRLELPVVLDTPTFTENKIAIYPNPMADMALISSNENIETISVISLTGIELTAKTVGAKNTELDLSMLSSGVYIIRMMSGNSYQSKTIIKK
jgi:hypothetical protein